MGGVLTGVTRANAHQDLADVDTGNGTVGLAEGTTHSGLEPIGAGTRQHLVDADDMEGVSAHAEVETLLTGVLYEVPRRWSETVMRGVDINAGYSLVGADTSGLKGLGAELLILVGDEVHAKREIVNLRTLAAEIEDPDLGVGDTTVEPGLGIRLED